jgi:hypothetical protein
VKKNAGSHGVLGVGSAEMKKTSVLKNFRQHPLGNSDIYAFPSLPSL